MKRLDIDGNAHWDGCEIEERYCCDTRDGIVMRGRCDKNWF